MRAPRYRFPDEVRSTTRAMASRMVEQGSAVSTPEELDSWLASEPAARESLERGGFGTAFNSHDLFPLLEVFIGKAGGAVAPPPDPQRKPGGGLGLALIVAAVAAVAVTVLMLVIM